MRVMSGVVLPAVTRLHYQPPAVRDAVHAGGEAGREVVAPRQQGGDVLQGDARLPGEGGGTAGHHAATLPDAAAAVVVHHTASAAGLGQRWTPGGRARGLQACKVRPS